MDKTASSDNFIIIQKKTGAYEVIRVQDGKASSAHIVNAAGCDCEGFKFRGTCVHKTAVDTPLECSDCSLEDARDIASDLINELEEYGCSLCLEPFLIQNGRVLEIYLQLKKKLVPKYRRFYLQIKGVPVMIWNGKSE